MTARKAVVIGPNWHTLSTTSVLPTCLSPCRLHVVWDRPSPNEFISWSVSASMHCCITLGGGLPPSKLVLVSHRPTLRAGRSIAAAGETAARRASAISDWRGRLGGSRGSTRVPPYHRFSHA